MICHIIEGVLVVVGVLAIIAAVLYWMGINLKIPPRI